jgi:hypothetical protein
MNKPLSSSRHVLLALLMLTSVVTLVFGAPAVSSAAPKFPKPKPNLRHARPLHGQNARYNELLGAGEEGDDDTAISLDPALSALCQSYLPSTNPYANPAPNVDQIVGDTIVTVGSQAGCASAQNETTIAVNPYNPNNLVAGANDYRVFNSRENRNDSSGYAYTSSDGGATWTNVQLPHLTFQTGATGLLSDMDGAGDPVVAFGPNNTVYYANIAFSRLNDGNAITVNVSHDGGLTWGEPAIVQADGVDAAGNPLPSPYFNDKVWIAADPNSGTAYVTWTRFGPSDSPIVVSVSHDFGATWSPFTTINPASAFQPGGITAYSQGSSPQVGRNGELYVAYESAVCQTLACDQPTDYDAVIVAKSVDGGSTFINTIVSPNYDFPYNPEIGNSALTGENFRINSFPQLTVDRQTGRLYVTWADDRNGQYDANGQSIKTNGDVFVVTSGNGTQWTQLYQVGTPADEVFPAIAAFNGRNVVTFYTRAYDPNGINLDYAYASAVGVGNIKKDNVTRITTESQNPQVQFVSVGAVSGQVLQGVFIGDYSAVALGSDLKFHPSWTDFRGAPGVNTPNQDAYTQSIPLR